MTEIGDSAFEGCEALTSINIPESVTRIGFDAFGVCEALTSVTIPNSVTEIGDSAFCRCEALTSIIVAEENKVYDSRGNCNAIIETKTNRLIQGCTNTVIPESVTEIGAGAFKWCEALTSVTIPNSVTEIGLYAFEGCEALTSVTIPNSVTKIGFSAFEGCKNLEELILCHTYPTQSWASEEIFSFAKQATLYVPKESVAAFQKDSFWSEFAAIKPITDDMLK